jgi:hypothetical protein
MSNNFEHDPLYQIGKRQQELQTDRVFQSVERAGQLEKAIQRRLGRWLLFGIPGLLLKHAPGAFWAFIAPCFCYLALMIGVGFEIVGVEHDFWGFLISLIFVAGVPLVCTIASMIYAYRRSIGIAKVAIAIQIPTATIFEVVAIWRALQTPLGHPPFEPKTIETLVGIALMLLLCGITILAAVVKAFFGRREME